MAVKFIVLALVILASLITEQAWCAVDDPCPNGNEDCGPTERCDTTTTQCVDRGTCVKESDCRDQGECDTNDESCNCDTGFTGNDCSKIVCNGNTCDTDQVCVGPDSDKNCFDDPCKDEQCGTNGDCSYDDKLAAPTFVCTCKNGYGGTTCTDEPECTTSEDCTDPDKPECNMEAGKKSVCAAKENGGNIVAATPGLLLSLLLAAIYL